MRPVMALQLVNLAAVLVCVITDCYKTLLRRRSDQELDEMGDSRPLPPHPGIGSNQDYHPPRIDITESLWVHPTGYRYLEIGNQFAVQGRHEWAATVIAYAFMFTSLGYDKELKRRVRSHLPAVVTSRLTELEDIPAEVLVENITALKLSEFLHGDVLEIPFPDPVQQLAEFFEP